MPIGRTPFQFRFPILSTGYSGSHRKNGSALPIYVDGARKWLEPEGWRVQWLNADRENPFPVSVSNVVDWLQRFNPKDGKSFEYAEHPDVCPAGGGLRLLQPSVATNSHP